MLRTSISGIKRAFVNSSAALALPDYLKLENIDIKKNKNQRFLEGPKERGRSSAQKFVVSAFQESDFDDVDFIDFFAVEEIVETLLDDSLGHLNAIKPGFEAETVGQLNVLYDGDLFAWKIWRLWLLPITQACQKANLIATSQNEVITIKIPPTTAASRKKLVKNVDSIEQSFSQKMLKVKSSQYLKAMEGAEKSEQYSEDLEDEWAAKSLGAHVILTLEGMVDKAAFTLSKTAEAKRHELLGTSPVSKKKKK
ncbi:Oidioi.mRNA.OKI2018_I69.chr1.g772.t1.cds [Oikopleura dioica]|uniref:Ribosome-recycling factor, mitochondrial n=1 Tax=Oikopleura dioica TaxID=34765 RepID=A0ABN7SPJ1_OIKDI|nr:Oidioi.mRNA.OKI2018_I69.chr1.g772.t1.cds [Oikopleura dioica]